MTSTDSAHEVGLTFITDTDHVLTTVIAFEFCTQNILPYDHIKCGLMSTPQLSCDMGYDGVAALAFISRGVRVPLLI